MPFICKHFDELTTKELYAILKVRTHVFVVEQNCAYLEVDGKDLASYHVFLQQGDDMIAYLRILPKGVSYEHVSIGRVLVDPAHRGQKLAEQMMNEAIRIIEQQLHETTIQIQAQTYLQAFYESLGFQAISESYLDDNIPHIDMIRR